MTNIYCTRDSIRQLQNTIVLVSRTEVVEQLFGWVCLAADADVEPFDYNIDRVQQIEWRRKWGLSGILEYQFIVLETPELVALV